MTSKHIGKPQKSAEADIDAAHDDKHPIDQQAHAVPEGAAQSQPTGLPTSDRHAMETAHDRAAEPKPRR